MNINQWSLVRTVPPTSEPVSVADMKQHSRIYISDDDGIVLAYISAARAFAEVYQNKQLLPATYRLKFDWFPSWTIKIPFPPLASVTAIKYLDTGGNLQTLATTEYLVDADSVPGRITPAYAKIWPVSRIQISAVEVDFVAGYPDAGSIPQTTVQAIKMLAAHWYEQREETAERRMASIPYGVADLLAVDRVLDFSGVLGSSNNMPGAVTAWGGVGWIQ